MGKFRQFLLEEDGEDYLSDSQLLALINGELADLSEDEIFAFAYVLYYEFFDDEDNPDDNYEDFNIDDVKEMIATLGPEYYVDILDLLLPDEEEDGFDWDSIELDDESGESEEMDEAVGRVMKRKNFNRKKRKFFKKTKADLRKGLAARKKANRKNMSKRKKFYRINKKRLASYQKSRATAVKKGRHMVKVRRGA
jgi:hypothetical protein